MFFAEFDAHTAPFAGTTNQLSPRIRLNFFPGPATTLYAYYGRLFVPTNTILVTEHFSGV